LCLFPQVFQQQQQQQQQQLAELCAGSREPSALAGILSERFLCGPQLTQQQLQDPYYSSELGQVHAAAHMYSNFMMGCAAATVCNTSASHPQYVSSLTPHY
jgi:hypothetical protein